MSALLFEKTCPFSLYKLDISNESGRQQREVYFNKEHSNVAAR
jgi:hypothetical protein